MSDRITARQLCAAGFTGSLSLSAAAARVGWRAALLAAPAVLLALWAAASAGERRGGLLNGKWGRPLAGVYMAWGIVTAGTVLALCGERISAAGGRTGPFWPTVLVSLPVLWLAAGKPEAFARAAEIFYLAMAAVLAFIFLLGAGQVRRQWLLAGGEDLGRPVLTAAGLGCTGVYAVLLWNGREKGGRRRFLAWGAAAALALAAMAALTEGSLSPALTARTDRPFFLMTVGLGRTARVESLVALLWLAADVTLLGLLLQACRELWRGALALKGEAQAAAAAAAAALALALCLQRFGDSEALLRGVLPLGGLILGFAVPVLLWLLDGREREEPAPPEVNGPEGSGEHVSGAPDDA